MTSRTFATLDPNALGPGLALSFGNQVVTTDQAGLIGTTSQRVHGTIAKAVGYGFFEGAFYSTSRGDLTGCCSIGVAEADSSLNAKVGEDAESWGFWPADGGIYNGGVQVVAGQPIAERMWIEVYLHMSGTSAGTFLAFYVDGNPYATVFLPDGKFWVPAGGVSSEIAGDLSAFINFGQRPFANQPTPVNS